MNYLPISSDENIQKFSNIFADTTTSYKFFFFISLLDEIQTCLFTNKRAYFSLNDVLCRMVINAWYPALFYKLNFGIQDTLPKVCNLIQEKFNLKYNDDENKIKDACLYILESKELEFKELKKSLLSLINYVPSKILSPWTPREFRTNGIPTSSIYTNFLSNRNVNKGPYYLIKEGKDLFIEINTNYLNYICNNIYVLKSFTYYHLCTYLEKRNSGVPNISTKLIEKEVRNSLKDERKVFDSLLELDHMTSIFNENIIIDKDEYAIDHFIPWSFVLNDTFYNLVPIDQSTNSQKSNKIPDESYIENLAYIHYKIVQYIDKGQIALPKEKIILAYEDLKPCNLKELSKISTTEFYTLMRNRIFPLMSVAKHNGFESFKILLK